MKHIFFLISTFLLLACGGQQSVSEEPMLSPEPEPPIDVLSRTSLAEDDLAFPLGIRMQAEVWPETESPRDLLDPNAISIVREDVLGPWPFVYRISGLAPELAAIAVQRANTTVPSARDVSICVFRGDVPLDRISYARVEENCISLGNGLADETANWTLFQAQEPFYAHYIWLIVRGPAAPFALAEVRVLTNEDLQAANAFSNIAIVELSIEANDFSDPENMSEEQNQDSESGYSPFLNTQNSDSLFDSFDNADDDMNDDDTNDDDTNYGQ